MRRALLTLPVLLLAACSDSDATPCTTGVSFYVAELAGTLAAGSSVPVQICFDGDCRELTVGHDDDLQPKFLEFTGITAKGDHTVRVSIDGADAQTYKGAVDGFSVAGGCTVGAVKIAADGTITPGQAAPAATTTTGA